MTLGMMTIARGIPLVFTNGTPIFGLSEEFNMIANSRVLGVPSLMIFLVITVLAGHIILSKTVLGRRIYAVGGNEDAARLSGVSTAKVRSCLFNIFLRNFIGNCRNFDLFKNYVGEWHCGGRV